MKPIMRKHRFQLPPPSWFAVVRTCGECLILPSEAWAKGLESQGYDVLRGKDAEAAFDESVRRNRESQSQCSKS